MTQTKDSPFETMEEEAQRNQRMTQTNEDTPKDWREEFDDMFIGSRNSMTPTAHTIVENLETTARDIEINGHYLKQFITTLLTTKDAEIAEAVKAEREKWVEPHHLI